MSINNAQAMLLQSERVSKNAFSSNLAGELNFIFSPLLSTLGIPHGDSELSKLLKN